MAAITDLPIEVIHIILQQKIVDIEDVINFSLTCRRFNDALDNNFLWKTKLYQNFDIRWPYLKKIYDNHIHNKESINFKDEVIANVKCRKALFSYLSLLSKKLFNKWQLSDSNIQIFDILFRPNIDAHTMNFHFLKNELLYQIKMSPLDPQCNLTHQYYSKMLLPFLQRRHLEDVWLDFINYPKEQQLLENAATIVAQWYQPQKCIHNFDIEASLDNIAEQTLNSLKKAHWDHSIFSTSAKQFSIWKYNNIDDNRWSKIEEKQIVDVLRTVLFDELGFHLHSTCNPNSQNIFIDCVLENKIGDALTLAIIFQSVARRLGVRCDLVCSNIDLWLYWESKSIAKDFEDKEYFYIDILNGETFQGRNYRSIKSYNKYEKISPTKMILFMNIKLQTDNQDCRTSEIRSLLKLLHMKELDSLDTIEMLRRNYSFNKTSISHFLFTCQASLRRMQNDHNKRKSVEASDPSTEDILRMFKMSVQYMNLEKSKNLIVSKNRTGNMKYAVGMIVTCIKNDLNQTGVIIGWDEKFNSDMKIKKYKQPNYKIILSYSQTCDTAEQPFYIILSEDGNMYYASQDTLIEAGPRWIEHSEIGRYFCRFANVCYVPNEALTRHYPHDQAVLDIYYLASFIFLP